MRFLSILCFLVILQPTSTAQIQAGSEADFRNQKRQLLEMELTSLTQTLIELTNGHIQLKVLSVTILVAAIGFIVTTISEKISKNKQTNLLIVVAIALVLLIFLLYWYDCYLGDIQLRARDRIATIAAVLLSLPTMDAIAVDNVPVLVDLTRNDIIAKVLFLWPPNFEQVLFYFVMPMIMFLATLKFTRA